VIEVEEDGGEDVRGCPASRSSVERTRQTWRSSRIGRRGSRAAVGTTTVATSSAYVGHGVKRARGRRGKSERGVGGFRRPRGDNPSIALAREGPGRQLHARTRERHALLPLCLLARGGRQLAGEVGCSAARQRPARWAVGKSCEFLLCFIILFCFLFI